MTRIRHKYLLFGVLVFGALWAVDRVQKKWHLKGWFQQKEHTLNKQLDALEKKAAKKYDAQIGRVRACIVPHAGLKYSGALAASCFRLVDVSQIKRIVILAPSHHVFFKGVALPSYDTYKLPNGVLEVDGHALDVLEPHHLFQAQRKLFKDPHDVEHSLEIELPLIIRYFNKVKLVPLIIGHLTESQRTEAVHELKKVIDEHTLVVASSDFTHYGPRFDYEPFKDQGQLQKRIKQLDGVILEKIFLGSTKEFMQYVQEKQATVCGKQPIAILLQLLKRKIITTEYPYLVSYSTSHEYDQSDPLHSVSYAGVVFGQKKITDAPYLTSYEKTELLKLARTVLQEHFKSTAPLPLHAPIKTNTLQKPYGAFVALKDKKGSLRGCVGSISAQDPLYKTIMQRAKSAAFNDSRFTSLKQHELPDTTVHISVLSEPRSAASVKDIVLGRHGIIFKQGNKQSVFLPKVPVEQGWTLQQTLEQLSKKAGLAKNAWKDKKTKLSIFESTDFGE